MIRYGLPMAYTDAIQIKRDGWYNNGAWSKFKGIMRDKLRIILEGQTPSDADYYMLCDIPDIIDGPTSIHPTRYSSIYPSARMQIMASKIRTDAINDVTLTRREDKLKALLQGGSMARHVEAKVTSEVPQGETSDDKASEDEEYDAHSPTMLADMDDLSDREG